MDELPASRYSGAHPLSPLSRRVEPGAVHLLPRCLRATKTLEDAQALFESPEKTNPGPLAVVNCQFLGAESHGVTDGGKAEDDDDDVVRLLLNAGIQVYTCAPHRLYAAFVSLLAASTGSGTEVNHSGFSGHEQRSPQEGPPSPQRLPVSPNTPHGA